MRGIARQIINRGRQRWASTNGRKVIGRGAARRIVESRPPSSRNCPRHAKMTCAPEAYVAKKSPAFRSTTSRGGIFARPASIEMMRPLRIAERVTAEDPDQLAHARYWPRSLYSPAIRRARRQNAWDRPSHLVLPDSSAQFASPRRIADASRPLHNAASSLEADRAQVQAVFARTFLGDLVTGVGMAHHAAGRIVPQHALDAPFAAASSVPSQHDHQARVLRDNPCRPRRRDGTTPRSRRRRSSKALSRAQSDTASEPSRMPSVSRLGLATEPESR